MQTKQTTPVEAYIISLKNYNKIGGNLSDAIVLAETLLIDSERKMIEEYQTQIRELKEKIKYMSGEFGNY